MRRDSRFSPALVVSCAALGISLCGVGYAAVALPDNSVGTRQVINHSLRRVDFAAGAAPGSGGPKGVGGLRGPRGPRGPAGPPGPFPDPLQSGKTIRGVWSIGGVGDRAGQPFEVALSFVFTLPTVPAVNRIAAGDAPTAACPAVNPPAATAGNFCLYETARSNLAFDAFVDPVTAAAGATREGLLVRYSSAGPGDGAAHGTWAVTAP